MYFCSPGTFYKFVYLHKWKKTAIVIMPSEISSAICILPKTVQIMLLKEKTKLTRRSQAFLGTSLRSARRSSCSFSKSSVPIGPTATWLIGLSLKELTKKENKQWKKHQIYTAHRLNFEFILCLRSSLIINHLKWFTIFLLEHNFILKGSHKLDTLAPSLGRKIWRKERWGEDKLKGLVWDLKEEKREEKKKE